MHRRTLKGGVVTDDASEPNSSDPVPNVPSETDAKPDDVVVVQPEGQDAAVVPEVQDAEATPEVKDAEANLRRSRCCSNPRSQR